MKNITIFQNLVNRYNELSYTHNYIFGFESMGNIYMVITTNEILPYITTLDKASSKCGGGYSLRFKPNKAHKELLKTYDCKVICSKEKFEDMVNNSKYNRGEIYEKIVTEYFGQEWTKDNVPFTKGGDLEVNGIAYQIKYQKATFCSEKILIKG